MPDPFYTWRSGRVYPGDRVYFWSPTGQLPPTTEFISGLNYLTINADLQLSVAPFPPAKVPTPTAT